MTYLEEQIEKYKNDPATIAYGCLLDFCETILGLMKERDISHEKMMELTGFSKRKFKMFLNCSDRLTFLDAAKIVAALDMDMEISTHPLKINVIPNRR